MVVTHTHMCIAAMKHADQRNSSDGSLAAGIDCSYCKAKSNVMKEKAATCVMTTAEDEGLGSYVAAKQTTDFVAGHLLQAAELGSGLLQRPAESQTLAAQ